MLPVVAGEEIYVEQIVRNMLTNAAKYTPIGTQVVLRAEHEGDAVAIRVLDDGPGIEASAADRAFELFYRDPTPRGSVAGSGIGLFVCASLVEAMGGPDLGTPETGGWLRVRLHAPGPPRRRERAPGAGARQRRRTSDLMACGARRRPADLRLSRRSAPDSTRSFGPSSSPISASSRGSPRSTAVARAPTRRVRAWWPRSGNGARTCSTRSARTWASSIPSCSKRRPSARSRSSPW